MSGNLVKNKGKNIKTFSVRGLKKHQHITRGYFLHIPTSCTVGIMAPVYVD